MSRKYRIAWLPGDGVGIEVMEAARIVLDRVGFDADYVHGDIGWEFWRSEGDAFPARTIDLLNSVDAAMFGAITSKPVKETPGVPLAHCAYAAAFRSLRVPAALQGLPTESAQLPRGN